LTFIARKPCSTAQAGLLRRAGGAAGDRQRLGEQVVEVEEAAEDVAGEFLGADARRGHGQVDHGRLRHAQLQVAADGAG
jgi:hypothetical protein